MDSPWDVLWPGSRFLGVEWHLWKCIGWLGNLVFFSRFLVQWYATERRKEVVVPTAFWWLSLLGSLLLLAYSIERQDSVFVFAYAFTWIPYIRNLIIHRRVKAQRPRCSACEGIAPPHSRYCPACGHQLADASHPPIS